MKALVFVSLLLACSLSMFAAEPSASAAKVQTGRMSSVQLLATGRASGSAPDGMRFLFLIARTPGTTGTFSLKETRDFLLSGRSYQEKTQAELGKRFEPSTEFNTAEGFFAKQPGARRLAPEDIKGAYVLTLAIGGAPLPPAATGEVTLHVGFNAETESFTFAWKVPPAPSAGKDQSAGDASARTAAGAPRMPAASRTRYVATEGVAFAPWTLDLKITEGEVTGAIYQHRSDPSGVKTAQVGPFEIFDGKVEANTVTFKAKTPGGERVITFLGERSGEDIRFTRSVEVKPGADAGLNGILGGSGAAQFVAKRTTPQ